MPQAVRQYRNREQTPYTKFEGPPFVLVRGENLPASAAALDKRPALATRVIYGVVKDSNGKITELRCTYLPESKSGADTSGLHVKGTLHWVSVAHAVDAEVGLYDRLFTVPEPDASGDFKSFINSNSLEVANAKCEPALATARPDEYYQFERLGYFTLDPDSTPQKQIWNRTVSLRDTWAKEAKR